MNQITEMKQNLTELFVKLKTIIDLESPQREYQMLRLAIIAEYDAANLYENMAHFCQDENVRRVLLDVAKEEKEHIGEFEYLLESLDTEHEPAEEEGEEEVKDLIKRRE